MLNGFPTVPSISAILWNLRYESYEKLASTSLRFNLNNIHNLHNSIQFGYFGSKTVCHLSWDNSPGAHVYR